MSDYGKADAETIDSLYERIAKLEAQVAELREAAQVATDSYIALEITNPCTKEQEIAADAHHVAVHALAALLETYDENN